MNEGFFEKRQNIDSILHVFLQQEILKQITFIKE